MSIYNKITKCNKKILVALLDPDKANDNFLNKIIKYSNKKMIDYLFVGGSIVNNSTDELIIRLKQATSTPIILFPGHATQISFNADAILFLSLISGRNAEYLIGHHVSSAISIKKSNLEVIPTGYILIQGEKVSSTEYISNTKPIPADKPEIAVSTAVAGELLGMKMIYLEAGSGSKNHISKKIISSVKQNINIPLAVGGGIKNKEDIKNVTKAGADIIVVGTAFENNTDLIPEFYETIKNI